jgi:hypothetical protein
MHGTIVLGAVSLMVMAGLMEEVGQAVKVIQVKVEAMVVCQVEAEAMVVGQVEMVVASLRERVQVATAVHLLEKAKRSLKKWQVEMGLQVGVIPVTQVVRSFTCSGW